MALYWSHILRALETHGVLILVGGPGSSTTTQVPPCLSNVVGCDSGPRLAVARPDDASVADAGARSG